MDKKVASNLRKTFLVAMLVSDAVMLFSWVKSKQDVCLWMFILINVIVIGAEIVCNLIYGKTVSTYMTKTLENEPKKRGWIYVGLICFIWAMVSLTLHWAIW